MLRDKNLTDGIGVRTAHNTPQLSLKVVPTDRFLTSVTSAKQKKTIKTAQLKDATFHPSLPLRRQYVNALARDMMCEQIREELRIGQYQKLGKTQKEEQSILIVLGE